MTTESPSLLAILRDAIRNDRLNLHTAMPGIIQSYSASTQLADIQPVCKRRYADDSVEDLPLIPDVPVMQPRTTLAWVNLPIKPGDSVLLIFCERSIESFRTIGGVNDPDDVRTHDLSDAIAIPGIFPDLQAFRGNSDNLELVNSLTKVSLEPDGGVLVENAAASLAMTATGDFEVANQIASIAMDASGNITATNAAGGLEVDAAAKVKLGSSAVDLLDLLDKTLDELNTLGTSLPTSITNTAIGPQPLINPAFATFAAAIVAIKAQLAVIKGA